jgi:hypothetical protein
MNKNLYQAELGTVGTSVISISRNDIKTQVDKDGYLLISVFADPTPEQKKANQKSEILTSSFNI